MNPRRLVPLMAVLLSSCCANAWEASWSQARSGANKDAFVDVGLNPSLFQVAWQASVGSGNYYDRGVAADDKYVYRTVRRIPSTNVEGYQIVAMEISTGREVWSRRIQGYYHSYEVGEPSVMDGVVYVNREGHSGLSSGTDFNLPRLIRIEAATGEVLSETTYPAQWSSTDRPIVTPDHVLAAGGYYGGLNAYAPDGQLQWFNRQAGEADGSAVFDEKVFQAAGRVFDLSTGEALSSLGHPDGSWLGAYPIVSDEGYLFYISGEISSSSTGYGIAVFDARTQEHLMDLALPVFPDAPYDGIISLASGGGHLAVKHYGGVTLYNLDEDSDPLNIEGVSINTNDILLTKTHLFTIFGSANVNSTLHAISIETGRSEWQMRVDYRDSFALSGDYLLVSNLSGITAIRVVPEPTALVLALLGLAGIACKLGRRVP